MTSFYNYHGTSLHFWPSIFFVCLFLIISQFIELSFSLFVILAGDYCRLYSLAPTCILFWMSCLMEVMQYHTTEILHSCHILLTDHHYKWNHILPVHAYHSVGLYQQSPEYTAEAKLPCYADNPLFSRPHAMPAVHKLSKQPFNVQIISCQQVLCCRTASARTASWTTQLRTCQNSFPGESRLMKAQHLPLSQMQAILTHNSIVLSWQLTRNFLQNGKYCQTDRGSVMLSYSGEGVWHELHPTGATVRF